MELLSNEQLEASAVVANCRMNRERNLRGSNGYDRDLRFDPLEYLRSVAEVQGSAAWLDLCCGTGKALIEAAIEIEKNELSISIIGVDLVGMFDHHESSPLELVEASLTHWQPTSEFDLITCVHGLHYVGDKLGLIERATSWLAPYGRLTANLDRDNLKLEGDEDLLVIDELRKNGFSYSALRKLLEADGIRNVEFSFQYLGADDQAGPNYTGQPAVNSWYRSQPDK